MPSVLSSENYDIVFFNNTVNICLVHDGIFPNYVLRKIFEDLQKRTGFKFTCPLPQGDFSYSEQPIFAGVEFPLLVFDGKFRLTFTIRVQTAASKKIVDGYMVDYYGTYTKK